MIAARLLSQGRLHIHATLLDRLGIEDSWRFAFRALGITDGAEPRTFVPSYPLGYPLLMAPFGALGGWNHAPFYVVPIAALLTLFAVYKIGRELGLDHWLSVAAAVLLATSPAWNNQAIQPMSDVVATLWCAVAMLGALRSERSARWAIVAGAAFGMAVLVRPSDLLLAPAIALAMRVRWRPLATAAASSLPFAIAFMLANASMYGNALATGYGRISELVSWSQLSICGPYYGKWTAITLTPLVFPIGLLAAFDRKVTAWHRAALFAWCASFFGFYSFYAVCDTWWYVRFLLPAFPPLLVGTMLLMRDFVSNRAVRMALVTCAAIAGVILCGYFKLDQLHDQEIAYAHAVHWAQKQLPDNAIVTAFQFTGAYLFYADRLSVRYREMDPQRFEELRAYTGNDGLKWYALIFDWEEKELRERMPGRWTKVNGMRNVVLLRLDS